MTKLFYILALTLAVLAMAPNCRSESIDSVWTSAGSHYENNDYEEALNQYIRLYKNGYISAELLFNIGNCYFKQGEIGYAILYYLRAQRLDPNDDDISANLSFARQFLPTRMEGTKINPLSAFMDMVTAPFTLNMTALVFSALFILFILMICLFILWPTRGLFLRMFWYALLILMLTSAGIAGYKFRTEYITQTGVLVASGASVYSAPSEKSDLEFKADFGLTFIIKKSTDQFYLVLFENNRLGWVNKKFVEVI